MKQKNLRKAYKEICPAHFWIVSEILAAAQHIYTYIYIYVIVYAYIFDVQCLKIFFPIFT